MHWIVCVVLLVTKWSLGKTYQCVFPLCFHCRREQQSFQPSGGSSTTCAKCPGCWCVITPLDIVIITAFVSRELQTTNHSNKKKLRMPLELFLNFFFVLFSTQKKCLINKWKSTVGWYKTMRWNSKGVTQNVFWMKVSFYVDGTPPHGETHLPPRWCFSDVLNRCQLMFAFDPCMGANVSVYSFDISWSLCISSLKKPVLS